MTEITTPEPGKNLALGYLSANAQDAYVNEKNIAKEDVARAEYELAKLFYDKSDFVKAQIAFERALKFCETPRDGYTVLKILGFLIRIASERLEDDRAVQLTTAAEKVMEELGNSLGSLSAEYFYNMGMVKNYRSDFMAAKESFEIAYRKSKEENDPELLAKCLLGLADNAFQRKEFNQSLQHIDILDQLLKIVDKNYLKGAMYQFCAKINMELGNHEQAVEFYKKANTILQQKKCWNLYGYNLLGKGVVFKLAGDFEKAQMFFQLAGEAADPKVYKRLHQLINSEIKEVDDASVDIFLDRSNRKVVEKTLGTIDFKHRFVLLEILFLLAKNPGVYFDKEKLAKSIWKDEYNPLIHDKLIYTSISRLRKLIEPKEHAATKRKYLIRGKDGYTFNPEVKIRFSMESKVPINRNIANVDLGSLV